MKTFNVTVLGADKKLYDGQAVSLTVRAGLGWMNVLADHAPYLTTLLPGKIAIRRSLQEEAVVFSPTGSGVMEVFKNQATIFLKDLS